ALSYGKIFFVVRSQMKRIVPSRAPSDAQTNISEWTHHGFIRRNSSSFRTHDTWVYEGSTHDGCTGAEPHHIVVRTRRTIHTVEPSEVFSTAHCGPRKETLHRILEVEDSDLEKSSSS